VVTWKDQSGNGNDATAAAPTNEPTIYTGGQLVKESGKVAVEFGGTNDGYLLDTSSLDIGSLSSFTVGRMITISNAVMLGLSGSDGNKRWYAPFIASGNFNYGYADNASAITTTQDTNQNLHTMIAGTTLNGVEAWLNSTSVGTATRTTGAASGQDGIANLNEAFYANCNIQEVIYYASDKSSVRTSIESNIGDYFTQNTPLLDTYSGAAAAYSLRLLDSTYTGALINVWNGTSYADIYPNVFGELDTVALAAHCGSNNGFIRTWYDQSGNSNDAAQTTTADMPKIYDGTTGVVTENGKPTVQFDGATDYMEFGESWGAQMTMIVTWKAAATGEQQIYNMESGGVRFAMSTNRGGNSIVTRDNSGAGTSSLSGNPTITTLGITSHITNSTSTSHSLHHNNVSLTGTSSARAQNGTNTFASNSGGTSFFLNGVISEAVLYLSDKTTDRTDIEDNINTFYNIY
jgi:hypothetical protein